jgi:DNA mismatch repair protein MutS
MNFIADKQTLKDLNLLGKYSPDSIFSLFNQVKSQGGEKLLDNMFRSPLMEVDDINRRSATFLYFQKRSVAFPFDREQLEVAEAYIMDAGDGNLLTAATQVMRKKLLAVIVRDERYSLMQAGLLCMTQVLRMSRRLLEELDAGQDGVTNDIAVPDPYHSRLGDLRRILHHRQLDWLAGGDHQADLSLMQTVRIDHLLRHSLQEEMKELLTLLYELDVLIAVSGVAAAKGFSYAQALPRSSYLLHLDEVRHPGLPKGIANSLTLGKENNVMFLTGANMAGKSTLMKTVGVSVYLAHMGFPVAARAMAFSVKEGIFTSINVADDLSMGYSHFYAEVLRVKRVAEEVGEDRNLLVIFDELFKGTNVKDAYDATLAVSRAFARYRNCSYIISTHIIEVGEELRVSCGNMQFSFLPTIMKGVIPTYTYRLQEGITTDRHGMMIIENEGILDIINNEPASLKTN